MKDTKGMVGGVVALAAGIALIGTSGATFVLGCGLWLVGLVAVLGAVRRDDDTPLAAITPAFEPVAADERQAA